MISTKKNNKSTFIPYLVSLSLLFILFYFLFNKFSLTKFEANSTIKTNIKLRDNSLKLSINRTDIGTNYFILQTVKLPGNI